jgi:hypothetical protein
VTQTESNIIATAAHLSHMEVSTWIRVTALREADRLNRDFVSRSADYHLGERETKRRTRKGAK